MIWEKEMKTQKKIPGILNSKTAYNWQTLETVLSAMVAHYTCSLRTRILENLHKISNYNKDQTPYKLLLV